MDYTEQFMYSDKIYAMAWKIAITKMKENPKDFYFMIVEELEKCIDEALELLEK